MNVGGDRGDRTPNLGIANAALSQLSYVPTQSGHTRNTGQDLYRIVGPPYSGCQVEQPAELTPSLPLP